MTRQVTGKYWLMQFLGWGLIHLLLATQSFQAVTTGQETLIRVLILSPVSYLSCIFASHLLFLWNKETEITSVPLRGAWPRLVPVIALIAILISTVNWFVLKALALYYPPPVTRSETIAALFDSFLLFILNFALVYGFLLGLWWTVYLGIARKYQAVQLTPAHETPSDLDPDSPVMISDGKQSKLITPSHIEYAFSEGNYVKLVGDGLNMLIRGTLTHLESRLAGARFFRVNRHTLVNLMKVKGVDESVSGNTVLTLESGKEIEASRRQSQLLKKKISL